MKDLIVINNLNFSYGEKKVINNLNLKIKKDNFITILGASGSGKTTLVNILSRSLDYEGQIRIDNLDLKATKSTDICFCLSDSHNIFIQDSVFSELEMQLKKQNLLKQDSVLKIEELANNLGINHLLDCAPYYLSSGEKQIVSLARKLVVNPKILILDDSLSMLDNVTKENVFKYLKKLNKKQKMTIIHFTQSEEDSLYGKDIVILNSGSVIMNDKKEIVLTKEKLFKDANLELPFIADLSLKLKYYGLIDHIILDMNKMVRVLWK